jgi:hypothetical protein
MYYYSPSPDKYTSYRDVLTTQEERLHAAQQQWLFRYEPLTEIFYPQEMKEPGVAYPSPKRKKGDSVRYS